MNGEFGLLGKLRARGDFVRVRAGGEPFAAFDDWLTENMNWVAARALDGWPEAYAEGAIQAFFFRSPGSPLLLSGALGPSQDAAGRRFPLVVAAPFAIDAELAAAPHVLPIVHESVWQTASDLVAEIRETVPDADPAHALVSGPSEFPPSAAEALGSYGAWLDELPLAELWEALYGDASGTAAARALRLLAEAVRPYAGVESPKTPLSLRMPLGQAGGAAVCFWLDLVRRWIGWRATVPSLFWSHDGSAGTLILHVGSPPKNTVAELWLPDPDRDEFCDLGRVSDAALASLPELPAEESVRAYFERTRTWRICWRPARSEGGPVMVCGGRRWRTGHGLRRPPLADRSTPRILDLDRGPVYHCAVATGFVLRAYLLDDSSVSEHRFGALPIRIGRNPLNDYHIKQGFVSDFHARIEEMEGRIYMRDLGSRNGVFLRASGQETPARIEAQTAVELGPYGYEFFLGPLLRLKLDFVQDDLPFRHSSARGSVLGNPEMLAPPQGGYAPQVPPGPAPPGVDPYGAQPFGGVAPSALPALSGYPPGAPAGYGVPGVPGVPGAPGAPPGYGAPGDPPPYPGVSGDPAAYSGAPAVPLGYGSAPAFQPAPAAGGYAPYPPAGQPALQAPGGRPERRTSQFSMDLDSLAMQGLRELATSLVPNQQLTTTGDIARLITKLHDAIEVFCRCFIPLREGYAQFVSAMDLERAAMQRSQHRSRAYIAIETAKDPGTVAAALLDWRDQSLDAPKAIEGIFADLMVHQVALLDGVMQGVRAMLDELSPDNLERGLKSERSALGLAVGRHKALWQEYQRRYEELCEEKQAFLRIFGREFTEAYHEYRRRRAEGGGSR